MAANRMQRIFQLRSSEKSFVSRISPRNPCLPAIIIFIFDYCKIYLIHNKRKNFVELIEFYEVFSLENLPSCEATHTQSWQIFRAGKNLGKIGKLLGNLALATDFSVKFLLNAFTLRSGVKFSPKSSKTRRKSSCRRSIINHSNRNKQNYLFFAFCL